MTDFVRRLVSLDKARYKDDELDIDLGAHIHKLSRPTMRGSQVGGVVQISYISRTKS